MKNPTDSSSGRWVASATRWDCYRLVDLFITSKFVINTTTPQSYGILQRQYLWKKRLHALMGGSHFASKDAKPHFFTLLWAFPEESAGFLVTWEPLKLAMIYPNLIQPKASPVQWGNATKVVGPPNGGGGVVTDLWIWLLLQVCTSHDNPSVIRSLLRKLRLPAPLTQGSLFSHYPSYCDKLAQIHGYRGGFSWGIVFNLSLRLHYPPWIVFSSLFDETKRECLCGISTYNMLFNRTNWDDYKLSK